MCKLCVSSGVDGLLAVGLLATWIVELRSKVMMVREMNHKRQRCLGKDDIYGFEV